MNETLPAAATPAAPARLNPWLGIWLQPRATLRQLMQEPPREAQLMALVVIGTLATGLSRAGSHDIGAHLSLLTILLLAGFSAALSGILLGYLAFSALLQWTGSWLGGRASNQGLRTAIAWSNVPLLPVALMVFGEIALFGSEALTRDGPAADGNLILIGAYGVYGILGAALWIWSVILSVICIAEAQGFSAPKALANILLSMLVPLSPIALIALFFWVLF